MLKDKKFRWLIAATILVGILELLSLKDIHLPILIEVPFFLLIILGFGYKTLWHGLNAIVRLNFRSINSLMLIAVVGAFYLKKYEEAAVIIVLFSLAEKLEILGIEKSLSSLDSLIKKMPKLIQLKDQYQVPIDQVKIGSLIIIKPGEMIALDGSVVLGSSYIDESPITGESLPQGKFVGDPVYAGTLNQTGYLEIKVTKTASETTFAKIQKITLEATKVKAKTQKFIESFSQYYTPSVIALALFLAIFPPFFFGQSFDRWLLNGLSLLVIACPCALVISTPISIFAGIGNASSQGALIKGGLFLELIGQVKAIAFDKTCTLTYGQPIISDIIPFGNNTKEKVLQCTAGIEIFSEHPLAQSIVKAAKEEQVDIHSFENFQSILGKGAKANCLICEDVHHCVGKLSFILEEHSVSTQVLYEVKRLESQGKISIVIATNEGVEGIIALTDEIRPESKLIIEQLKKLGIYSIILTGDHATSAQFVAQAIGVSEVRADLLPEDKAKIIQELIDRYKIVAMVGDGINDAPALAFSSVGITMGSIGSDTAIETASIVILKNRLDLIPRLIALGKRVISIIKVNTIMAIAVKLIFIALALVGRSSLAMAIFADVGVTILVILNSLRLAK